MTQHYPASPPRLPMVFNRFDPPMYFITFCTFDRRPLLANGRFHDCFVEYMKRKNKEGIACGEFVIMPDHIHMFLRIDRYTYQLGKTIGFMKQALSKPLRDLGADQPHWQPGFFDHVLRSSESYSEKWNYVRNNPVRAGLVNEPDDWRYTGQIVPIQY